MSTNSVQRMHEEEDRRVGSVFVTMIFFSAAMILAPISSYFLSKNYFFDGK
jgi:hypothetical protein